MAAEQSINIDPAMDGVTQTHAVIDEFSEAQQWPSELEFQMRLMLEELVMNVVSHGLAADDPQISLALQSDEAEARAVLTDNGPAFNPLDDAPSADTETSVEDRSVGGLGVHFVKTIADDVQYERVNDRNVLTIVKHRTG